jgi:hypothetical protein
VGDVTVRITVVECPGARTIRVEGRLTSRELGELAGVLGADLASVRLELSHLLSLDHTALAFLRGLHGAGVEMRGAMPHLAWQITDEEP